MSVQVSVMVVVSEIAKIKSLHEFKKIINRLFMCVFDISITTINIQVGIPGTYLC